jgi:hypothetical protein
MKKYTENVVTISDWSNEVFPALTPEMQVKKLEEELREVERAENTERWTEEMADVYIVACILWGRFKRQIGRMALSYLEMLPEYHKIREEADKKMIVNRNRCWHINENGVYHH